MNQHHRPSNPPSSSMHGVSSHRSLPVVAEKSGLDPHPGDSWQPADPYPMSRHMRQVFRALILAICPTLPAPHSPEMVDRVEMHVRRFMRYMNPLLARGLWLGIWLLDWAPRLWLFSVQRLHRLEPTRAGALLARMAERPMGLFRMLVVAVRGLVLSAYFDQEEVHRAINYTPRRFMRKRMALRESLRQPEEVLAH